MRIFYKILIHNYVDSSLESARLQAAQPPKGIAVGWIGLPPSNDSRLVFMKIFIKTNFLCKNSYFLNNYVQFSHPPNNIFIFPIKRSKKKSSFLIKQRVKSSLKKYYYYYKIWNLSNCCNLKLLSSLKNTGLILELKMKEARASNLWRN